MRILGFDIARTRKALSPVSQNGGGWWPLIRESYQGAFQQNVVVDQTSVLAFHAVFACISLIAGDIAKLRVKLVERRDGIWQEGANPAYSPVLRKPNSYQTRIQYWESYVISKLTRGNTYVLKRRDGRGVVVGLYVLDPTRVRPLVSDAGEVFYELNTDNLSGLEAQVTVPARDIIHDRFNCLFHPLVGISPIFACGLAATQGLAIQNNSAWFFGNRSQPGGILLAPGKIDDATAARLKAYWEDNYSGNKAGKVAVLGDGLKYEGMAVNPVDAQLVEQLKWSAEVVCSTFHVPPYKIGVGALPSYNNVQALNVEYYSQALQYLIEAAELCLDEGLGLSETWGVEFDLDGLLRMDAATQMEVLDKGKNLLKPNEARGRLNLPPVTGGDTVYRQQQDFSLEALSKRDAREDPFAAPGAATPPAPAPAPANDDAAAATRAALAKANERAGEAEFLNTLRKGLG